MSTISADANGFSVALSIKSELIADYIYTNDPPPLALSDSGSLSAIGGGLVAVDNSRLVFFERSRQSQSGWKASPIEVPMPQTAIEPGIVSIIGFEVNGGSGTTLNVLCLFKARVGFAVAWIFRPDGGTWQPAVMTSGAASLLSQVMSVDVFNAGAGTGQFVYGVTTQFLTGGNNNSRLFSIYLELYESNATSQWQAGSQVELWTFSRHNLQSTTQFRFLTTGSQDAQRDVGLAFWDSSAGSSITNTLFWTSIGFSMSGFDTNITNVGFNQSAFDAAIAQLEPDHTKPLGAAHWPAFVLLEDNLSA